MSIRVTNEDGFNTHERKDLRIQIFAADGSPVNLTELSLRYVLRKQFDYPDLITKTSEDGITVEDAGEEDDNSVAVVAIDAGEITEPNLYWHAIRDDTHSVMLGAEDVYIGPGIPEPEEEE